MISMKNKKFLHELPMLSLLGMLVFSHPLMTASVAAKDAKSDVKVEAKRDAERDAKSVHKLWFAGGCLGSGLPYLSLYVLLFAEAHGVYIDIGDFQGADKLGICCLSVIGAGTLLPTWYAIFHSPTPPADQLLGKSLDYVNAYTTAYRRKVQREQIVLSATGCLVGTGVGVYLLSNFIP